MKHLFRRGTGWSRGRGLFSVYTRWGRFDLCIGYGWQWFGPVYVPHLQFFICHNPDAKGNKIWFP